MGSEILRSVQDGFVTREPLVPINDDVTIECVEFHRERVATTLLRADHRRATTAEEVEHILTLH